MSFRVIYFTEHVQISFLLGLNIIFHFVYLVHIADLFIYRWERQCFRLLAAGNDATVNTPSAL